MNDYDKTITVNAVDSFKAALIADRQLTADPRTRGKWTIVRVEQGAENAPDDMVMLYQVATGKSTFLVRIAKVV